MIANISTIIRSEEMKASTNRPNWLSLAELLFSGNLVSCFVVIFGGTGTIDDNDVGGDDGGGAFLWLCWGRRETEPSPVSVPAKVTCLLGGL